ncbi:MAG: hypothetical protein ACOYT4_01015 [Nanoarchaeota archaeon]
MKRSKGQQEIAGFALIVVVVLIAGFIFLIITAKKGNDNVNSKEIDNFLSAMMHSTTNCAIEYEPNYDNIQDLIQSCFNNKKCSNLNRNSCEYLNETLDNMMTEMIKSENQIANYSLNINYEDKDNKQGIIKLGHIDVRCINKRGAMNIQAVKAGKIKTELIFCYT